MFVADQVSGFPEILCIRLVRPGYQDVASALHIRRFPGVIELKMVHLIEIEAQHPAIAVDFKRISVAATDSEAACFEGADTSIREAGQESGSVVHIAAGHECVTHRYQFGDRTVEKQGKIDGMR